MFVVGWTGFCVKPLRDSGAITIPELFEHRYGKFVRWLSGVVIVLGGLLNMGVFLRVGGQFLVVCCGMNLKYLEIAMTVLLVGVAVYTILGGMLSVLVTDFLQFVVMSVGLLVVSFLILSQVGWDRLVDTVQTQLWRGRLQSLCQQGSWLGVCAVQSAYEYRGRADLADLHCSTARRPRTARPAAKSTPARPSSSSAAGSFQDCGASRHWR